MTNAFYKLALHLLDHGVILETPVITGLDIIGAMKTEEYFNSVMTRLVKQVYNGNMGGDFIDLAANLISGQIRRAYDEAWKADGNEDEWPDWLNASYQDFVANQYSYVDGFYQDIVDARVDKTSIDPLLSRAELWSNRYNDARNEATRVINIESGGKLVWELGATEEHCDTCARLNGIVAYASEWETAGFKPQNGPNDMLDCGGWQCDCSCNSTDRRRSPKALDTLLNIAADRSI